MGQYYKIALVNEEGRRKIIRPNGFKLMEHSYYGSSTMDYIEKQLEQEELNVMWIGDYSQCAKLVWNDITRKEEFDLYDIIFDRKKNSDLDYFLVNEYSREFINMTKQEIDGIEVHPLPLLCRAFTEEAGGDYHSEVNKDKIGIWCGDLITIKVGKKDELEYQLKEEGYSDMTDIYFFKE